MQSLSNEIHRTPSGHWVSNCFGKSFEINQCGERHQETRGINRLSPCPHPAAAACNVILSLTYVPASPHLSGYLIYNFYFYGCRSKALLPMRTKPAAIPAWLGRAVTAACVNATEFNILPTFTTLPLLLEKQIHVRKCKDFAGKRLKSLIRKTKNFKVRLLLQRWGVLYLAQLRMWKIL